MMQAVRGEYKGTGKTRERRGRQCRRASDRADHFLIIVIFHHRLEPLGAPASGAMATPAAAGPLSADWAGRRVVGRQRSGGGGFSGFSGGGGSFGGGGAGSSW